VPPESSRRPYCTLSILILVFLLFARIFHAVSVITLLSLLCFSSLFIEVLITGLTAELSLIIKEIGHDGLGDEAFEKGVGGERRDVPVPPEALNVFGEH
jgi:hypothetical protein